jgi:predicted PurR-regulated permease PerM
LRQTETDWFRPLWRRVAVTAFIVVWFAWEALYAQDQFWMLITGAALAYAVWNFFIKFDQRGGKGGGDGGPQA